jgi:hypothetical protein
VPRKNTLFDSLALPSLQVTYVDHYLIRLSPANQWPIKKIQNLETQIPRWMPISSRRKTWFFAAAPFYELAMAYFTRSLLAFLDWATIAYTQNQDLGVFLYGMQYQSRSKTSGSYEYCNMIFSIQQKREKRESHAVDQERR